jgi:hypothetical protein
VVRVWAVRVGPPEAEAAEKDHFPFQCHLKTNKDPLRLLQKMADDIPLACAVTAVRGMGHTTEKSFFEIACRKKPENAYKVSSIDGFVLATQRSLQTDKPVTAASCFNTQANPNLRCTLTKVAGIIDTVQRYVAKNAAGCMPAAMYLRFPVGAARATWCIARTVARSIRCRTAPAQRSSESAS